MLVRYSKAQPMRRLLAPCLLLSCFLIASATAQARTWTDAATGRTLEAEFVKAGGGTVTLKRASDGMPFTLPLSRLSAADQAFVAAQAGAPAATAAASKPGRNAPGPKVQDDRYTDIKPLKKESIPATGEAHAKLAALDDAVLEFMVARGIPAASFALSKNGRLLHERAFGWADPNLREPFPTGMSMRLASISKPITQAGIRSLVADGKLKLEDKVFEVLELEKLKPRKLDERWKLITIGQLIEHKGGFDRDKSGDASYQSPKVCADLRIKLQDMQTMDLVRWYLEQPLDFDPGARDVYSNFGYTLLARVVEKVSGKSFTDYLNASLGLKAGMTTLRVSRSDPRDRLPGEAWYCLHPEYTQEERYFPVRMEAKDGSGALACSAADYCRFLEHYVIDGSPRVPGGRYSGTFFGSTPGCTSVCSQRPDGIVYTIICNRRGAGGEDWNKELKAAVDKALEAVAADL